MHREVFKANNPGRPLRVYFLTYANSVEEQRYRTSVRREKEAFESLIKEKASMVLPSDPASLAAEAHSQAAAAAVAAFGSAPRDSRAGGARALAAAAAGREQVVIVDTREFRSSLPSILHARNMRLVPVTLEVGDYILSPVRRTTKPHDVSALLLAAGCSLVSDRVCFYSWVVQNIAVERKSIPDLFGSFASGRLYSQADAMCRHYKVAVLLIEFDESKPFALQLTGANSRDSVKQEDLTSKLAVLLMHFPTLRLLWCASHTPADISGAAAAASCARPRSGMLSGRCVAAAGCAPRRRRLTSSPRSRPRSRSPTPTRRPPSARPKATASSSPLSTTGRRRRCCAGCPG